MKTRTLLIVVAAILSCDLVARAQTNAYEYFQQAADALVGTDFTQERAPQEDAELVERNAKSLALVRAGLAFDYQAPPRSTEETFAFYLGSTRWRPLARLLRASGAAHAAKNDWRGSANDYVDAVKLGIEVTRGEVLIGMLHGQATQRMGRRPLEESLAHLDADTAQYAARRLETIFALAPSFADTMRAEAVLGATLVEKNLFGEEAMLEYLKGAMAGYREEVVREYRQLLKRQIEDAARPYILSRQEPALEDVETVKFPKPEEADDLKKLPAPPRLARMHFKMVLPVYQKGRLDNAIFRAQNQMLVAALALRAYYAANGKYPAELAELVPIYLEKVPTDPFGLDSPLVYRNAGAEYSLHSVGADGKDDGGRPVKNDGESGRQEYSARRAGADAKGDIVFGVNN